MGCESDKKCNKQVYMKKIKQICTSQQFFLNSFSTVLKLIAFDSFLTTGLVCIKEFTQVKVLEINTRLWVNFLRITPLTEGKLFHACRSKIRFRISVDLGEHF